MTTDGVVARISVAARNTGKAWAVTAGAVEDLARFRKLGAQIVPWEGDFALVNVSSAAARSWTADFGYAVVGGQEAASYTIVKRLNTPEPVRVGREVSFTISILNTSDKAWITYLPLRDVYSTTFLSYVSATPASIDTVNDGELDWQDLTQTFGAIQPGRTVDVVVTFRSVKDTWMLPGGKTANTATAYDVWTDPDGPTGPEFSSLSLPDKSSTALVPAILPTGMAVTGFVGQIAAGGVLLSWETANETNIAGFRVLRQGPGGQWVAANRELLFAEHSGGNQSGKYSFSEAGLRPGVHVYVLEIVKLDGGTERVGPVEVRN